MLGTMMCYVLVNRVKGHVCLDFLSDKILTQDEIDILTSITHIKKKQECKLFGTFTFTFILKSV